MYDTQTVLPIEFTNDSMSRAPSLYECDPVDLSILEAIGREPGSISSSIAQSIYTSKCTVLNRTANLEVLGLIERKQHTARGAYENYLCIDLEPLVAHTNQDATNSNMPQFNDSDKCNIDWVQQMSQCPKKPFLILIQLFSGEEKTASELKLISSDSVSTQTIYSRLKVLISLNLVCRQYSDRKARYVYIAQPQISFEAINNCLKLQKFADVRHILEQDIQMAQEYSNNSNSVVSKVAITPIDESRFIPTNLPSFLEIKENKSVGIKLRQLKTAILETLLIVVSSPQICSTDITAKHPRNLNNSTIHHYLGSLMELDLVYRSQLNEVNNSQGRSLYYYMASEEVNISMIEEIFAVRRDSRFNYTDIKVEKKLGQLSTDTFGEDFDSNTTMTQTGEIPQSIGKVSEPINQESQMDRFIEKLVGKIHNFDNDVDKIATVLEELVGKVHNLETTLEQAMATISQYQVRLEGVESNLHNNPPIYNRQKLDRLIESLK